MNIMAKCDALNMYLDSHTFPFFLSHSQKEKLNTGNERERKMEEERKMS